MWWKAFRDYPPHQSVKQQQVEAGRGIVGCEMHDLNGWGEEYHHPAPTKKGWFTSVCDYLFGTKSESGEG
jgi:hypothetical protein